VSNQGKDSLVIFYDGVCALCNGFVRLILKLDRKAEFRYASFQGDYARDTLARHQRNPLDLDTVVVMAKDEDGRERLYSKSEAVLFILDRLGGLWAVVSAVFRPWPSSFLDQAYDTVAKSRYRIFGKLDSCPLPNPRFADRFIDSRQDRNPSK
jgi:predicted DCC family thiol-disulfide oxidoreductase YuxK